MLWRHIASNAFTLLAVGLFVLGGAVLWGRGQYTSAGPLGEPICLQVAPGSNITRVSEDLAAQGAVTSSAIFRMGADYEEKAGLLKAGSYLVEPGASMAEIVDAVTTSAASTCGTEIVYRIGVNRMSVLVRELDPATERFVERATFQPGREEVPDIFAEKRGQPDTRYRLVLAEGVTSWQVVEAMKAMDVLEGSPGNVPAEGALAPDSYAVQSGENRADVMERMIEAQEARVAEAWLARDPELPIESPSDLLTLASIIEKETGIAEERGQVASVFVNRLNQGMRLQTDPTVIYGITRGEGVLGRGLRRSELRRETPWNTYVIPGLPPTPIANPGRASLMAAAKPDETDFIFFVADGTGGHAFAKTLAEHNENVARWREIEAERAAQSASD
ncbi:MAG: endolytic transglycosylase MltG [Pseudomonadota bacterium]